MKHILPIAFILALLLSACGSPTATPMAEVTASLAEVTGLVEMKNPDQAAFTAAENGTSLQVQGQVRTGDDGRAALQLSTGSIVRVAPSSLFTLEVMEPASDGLLTRLKLEAGKLWIVLNGGSIDVETPSGLASVRGSFMSVWVDPDTGNVWVGCLEGWCVAGNDSGTLDLIAGQGGILYTFDPAGATPPPPPLLRTLTQDEIDEFLENNPELNEVMDAIIATASALPGQTDVPTPTLPPVIPSLDPEGACFSLTSPANGAQLTNVGAVVFSWSEQANAVKYDVTFTLPNGYQLTFPVTGTDYTRYMDAFPAAGAYQWQATAYDASGSPLCTAGPFSFSKPALPTPTKTLEIPTGLPTEIPTLPPSNTTIIIQSSPPDGMIIATSVDCNQFYSATITDPDGIVEVKLAYEIYEFSSGTLISGGLKSITPQTADVYADGFMINTTPPDGSFGTDKVYWHIGVMDGLENWTVSPTYYFVDMYGCYLP